MSLRGLDIALGALSAQQQAIDVLNHNIANANTPGYSRQRLSMVAQAANLVPSLSQAVDRVQTGNGVLVGSVERVRDSFLDLQVRQQTQRSESATVREDSFNKLQGIFNEPSDSGLGATLSKFWSAWQDLSANPSDTAARSTVLQQAMTLTSQVNGAYEQMQQLREALSVQAQSQATDFNGVADQLAGLNDEIVRAQLTGATPNDLLDRRDGLLDKLSQLADAKVVHQQDGTVSVFVDGQEMVNRTQVHHVAASLDSSFNLHLTWTDNNMEVHPTGGQLHGTLVSANQDVLDRITSLDTIAAQLRDEVNAVHVTGFDGNGAAGLDFFTGTNAGELQVSAAIQADVKKIAASGGPNAAGDGTVAMAIAQLATANTQVDTGTTLTAGLALTTSGATVQRVLAGSARPGAAYTLSSTAAGKLTLTATIGGSPVSQTIDVQDMTADKVQNLQFTGLGISLAVRSGAGPASAASLIADLTNGANNTINVAGHDTTNDSYQGMIVHLGIDARGATNDKMNANALLDSLNSRRDSVSGVSLDEESANLVKYMRAYQAAARVVTAMDDMLQTLIEGTGRVGR